MKKHSTTILIVTGVLVLAVGGYLLYKQKKGKTIDDNTSASTDKSKSILSAETARDIGNQIRSMI